MTARKMIPAGVLEPSIPPPVRPPQPPWTDCVGTSVTAGPHAGLLSIQAWRKTAAPAGAGPLPLCRSGEKAEVALLLRRSGPRSSVTCNGSVRRRFGTSGGVVVETGGPVAARCPACGQPLRGRHSLSAHAQGPGGVRVVGDAAGCARPAARQREVGARPRPVHGQCRAHGCGSAVEALSEASQMTAVPGNRVLAWGTPPPRPTAFFSIPDQRAQWTTL
jgi:hypothetical protein